MNWIGFSQRIMSTNLVNDDMILDIPPIGEYIQISSDVNELGVIRQERKMMKGISDAVA